MSLLLDFMILNIFLGLGWMIREKIPLLQKIFMPASVIGGILLLICGQQVLNLVPISAMIGKYPNFLIIVILTCQVFGSQMDKSRVRSYMDYTVVSAGTYGAQLFLGVGIGWILTRFWPAMPPNWGITSIYSFFAGHAAAGSAAQIFTEGGYPDFMGISMIVATVGLVAALSIGMPLINWGIRKGYCVFVDKPQQLPPEYFGGPMPAEKQLPIGMTKTSTSGINAIALQMFFISACIMLGYGIRFLGVQYISPYFKNINDLVLGIIGAIIIWPFMCKTRTSVYVDKKTCANISGFALEYLIVAAIASISVDTMVSFIVPITIYCVVMLIILTFLYIFISAKFCKEQWFEKMVNVFGQCIGNAATGMTLLRCIDPKNESCSADASGVSLFLFMPVWVGMIAVGPVLAMSQNGTAKLMLLGVVLMIVFYGIGFSLFRTKRKL